MPNDTPDYQAGANYVAIPQPPIGLSNVAPGPVNVSTAAYTSLLIKLATGGTGGTVDAVWLDANGGTVGTERLSYPPGTFYLKLPVQGVTLQLHWVGGSAQVTVYGGLEALQLASIVSDGVTPQDGVIVPYLAVQQATVVGTTITLGTTYASGRVWLNWLYSSTVTGYLHYEADSPGGGIPDMFVATSAEAVTLQGTTTAKWAGFVNLPAQPVTWFWTPEVAAASAACSIALVRG